MIPPNTTFTAPLDDGRILGFVRTKKVRLEIVPTAIASHDVAALACDL